jgi:hypothetical protein
MGVRRIQERNVMTLSLTQLLLRICCLYNTLIRALECHTKNGVSTKLSTDELSSPDPPPLNVNPSYISIITSKEKPFQPHL